MVWFQGFSSHKTFLPKGFCETVWFQGFSSHKTSQNMWWDGVPGWDCGMGLRDGIAEWDGGGGILYIPEGRGGVR